MAPLATGFLKSISGDQRMTDGLGNALNSSLTSQKIAWPETADLDNPPVLFVPPDAATGAALTKIAQAWIPEVRKYVNVVNQDDKTLEAAVKTR